MVTLLSMAVLGMTVPTLPASAASESGNEHEHEWHLIYSEFKYYTNVSSYTHQKVADNTDQCDECGGKKTVANEKFSEPHQQIPGTVYCACGYQLH